MGTSHDRLQDQRLSDLDREVADLRKRNQANVRTMNKIAKDVNARLAALEKSGHQPPTAAGITSRATRPKPRPPRVKRTPKGVKPK